MVHRVTLDEAQVQLAELVDAAVSGETILIATNEDQVVQLVPVGRRAGHPQFGCGKGLMVMADDFDEPLAGFDEDIR